MAYTQKINSRHKGTPGIFRQDQEERYKNTGKVSGTENVYKFVSDTGEERYAIKKSGRYSMLYTDPNKKKPYTGKK